MAYRFLIYDVLHLKVTHSRGIGYLSYIPPKNDYPPVLIVSAQKQSDEKDPFDPVEVGDFTITLAEDSKTYVVRCYCPDKNGAELSYIHKSLEKLSFEQPICIAPSVMHLFLQFMDKLR